MRQFLSCLAIGWPTLPSMIVTKDALVRANARSVDRIVSAARSPAASVIVGLGLNAAWAVLVPLDLV